MDGFAHFGFGSIVAILRNASVPASSRWAGGSLIMESEESGELDRIAPPFEQSLLEQLAFSCKLPLDASLSLLQHCRQMSVWMASVEFACSERGSSESDHHAVEFAPTLPTLRPDSSLQPRETGGNDGTVDLLRDEFYVTPRVL